jgi:hypothetical protein
MAFAPRLFIGSSAESLPAAKRLAEELNPHVEAVVWPTIFRAADFTLEALAREVERANFAVLLFTPSDVTVVRHQKKDAIRDNVIFEFGLFVAGLGRRAALYVRPQPAKHLRIPSDLDGLTGITYDPKEFAHNMRTSMRGVATDVVASLKSVMDASPDRASFTGTWRQDWRANGSRNFPARNPSNATVLHVDRRFRAKFKAGKTTYVADGIVEGRTITGTWRDAADGGTYWGAFQLTARQNGERLVGKWVGHREDARVVAAGDWLWDRGVANRR